MICVLNKGGILGAVRLACNSYMVTSLNIYRLPMGLEKNFYKSLKPQNLQFRFLL
jgi:hypothetical protein